MDLFRAPLNGLSWLHSTDHNVLQACAQLPRQKQMCVLNIRLWGVEAVTEVLFFFFFPSFFSHRRWCLLCFLQLARLSVMAYAGREHCGVQFVARFSSASGCWAASPLLDFNGLWLPLAMLGASPGTRRKKSHSETVQILKQIASNIYIAHSSVHK